MLNYTLFQHPSKYDLYIQFFCLSTHSLNFINIEGGDLIYFTAAQILKTELSISFRPLLTIKFKICAQQRI